MAKDSNYRTKVKGYKNASTPVYRVCGRMAYPAYPLNPPLILFIYLFIIKIVHEVQQEKLKYTKETEQYTALGYQ